MLDLGPIIYFHASEIGCSETSNMTAEQVKRASREHSLLSRMIHSRSPVTASLVDETKKDKLLYGTSNASNQHCV